MKKMVGAPDMARGERSLPVWDFSTSLPAYQTKQQTIPGRERQADEFEGATRVWRQLSPAVEKLGNRIFLGGPLPDGLVIVLDLRMHEQGAGILQQRNLQPYCRIPIDFSMEP